MERVKAISEYYANLEYNKSNRDKLIKLTTLLMKISFHKDVSLVRRLEKLSLIIEKNLLLFVDIYKHIDVVMALIQYLYRLAESPNSDIMYQTYNSDVEDNVVLLALLNIRNNISAHMLIRCILQAILHRPISAYLYGNIYIRTYVHNCEMIILEDSDLYAIVNCLKITENYPLYKIWVQMSVMEKFLWLTKKYNNLDLSSSVYTFQSLKDIKLYACKAFSINIVSIWSENIVAAKNFALSLNKHVIYINSYMEFSGGAVFLPYINVCDQEIRRENIHKMRKVSIDLIDSLQIKNGIILNSPEETNCVIYHLFYGGMWQPPLLNMYTKHNFLYDIFLANVTNSDIVKCYESAEKGFEIWSAKSIKSRIEILSNLESMLISIGKPLLAAIVERWMSFPNVCPNVIGFNSACASSQYAKVEVMYTRMPLGVIFLKECNENALFVRLMQTLIAGNTVIVLNNANFSGILPYCNIFSTCGIPAGVINSLSHSDLNFLENKLFAGPHSDYIKDYFEKGTSVQSYAISYRNLTMPKQIVLPFK